MQGARRGTRSQDPGVTPWAEGRCLTSEPPGGPLNFSFKNPFYEERPLRIYSVPSRLLCCKCLRVRPGPRLSSPARSVDTVLTAVGLGSSRL